ncbi:MAG: DUF4349 domain-containing protein [Eubacteriales bacterium]|nr:DUF4349 domain-containing protein [Eubacteriales bacterium]
MQNEKDSLDAALQELYCVPTPDSFAKNWRQAVLQEEEKSMKTEKNHRRFWTSRALPLAAALVLVLGSLWAGQQDLANPSTTEELSVTRSATKSATPSAMSSGSSASNSAALYATETSYDNASTDAATEGSSITAEATDSRKLVRTADLTLRTSAFDEDLKTVQALVSSMGGYIENIYQNGDSQRQATRSANLYLRVPAAQLDAFLSGLEGVGRVVNRSESTTDMTVQYADNEARLSTLRQKMERLNALLAQAESVADLIEIESAIADTQYSIDSYETSQRTIDRRVDMSQVSVSLQEDNPVAVTSEMDLGQRLVAALQSSVEWLGRFFQNMLVFITMALPVLIPVAVLAVIWVIVRRRHKKGSNPDDTNP